MSIFEQAARKKLRFKGPNGQLNTEDLWSPGFSIESLKTIARELNKEMGTDGELDFIKDTNPTNAELTLKYEIVKHIILTKLEEKKKRDQAVVNADRRKKILEQLEARNDAKLTTATEEELRAELATLQG